MPEDYEKYDVGSSSETHHRHLYPLDSKKPNEKTSQTDFVQDSDIVEATEVNEDVKRDLKARHVSMIAIGGTIGTGLFVSTGSLLGTTGPVMALISFLFVTTLAYSVTQSLGEMSTYIPVSGSFAQF
ncbi:Lysine/arginine permease, partial [Candida maltosa Xu316]